MAVLTVGGVWPRTRKRAGVIPRVYGRASARGIRIESGVRSVSCSY